ncbi:MAG: hypothetical protein ACLPVW_18920 [Terriglobales bacterium]
MLPRSYFEWPEAAHYSGTYVGSACCLRREPFGNTRSGASDVNWEPLTPQRVTATSATKPNKDTVIIITAAACG